MDLSFLAGLCPTASELPSFSHPLIRIVCLFDVLMRRQTQTGFQVDVVLFV